MSSLNPEAGADRRQFQIVCCLGRGGFGEVYKAVLHSPGGVRTDVAIKVLHAEADPRSQAVQRLRDEGRLLGAIHHPSVLKVHDLCVLAGRVGLVTEYVDGQDLDKLFHADDGPGERALVEIVGHVASALDAAWSTLGPDGRTPLHLVHRDVKPANIRIGSHGEVKLLDFGIARADTGREARTESQSLLGSYLYMAPERFLEDEARVTCASDVFALGCTWFEAVARERLFTDFGLQQVYMLVLNRPRFDEYVAGRLATLPARTDRRIVELLGGMLDFEPAERPWPSELARICQDLAEELPGPSLARWARARTWPPPKTVQGVLDGEVITEAASAPVTSPTLERPGRKPGPRLAGREPVRSVAPASEREARGRPRPAAPTDAAEATVLSPVVRVPAASGRLGSPRRRMALGLAMGGTAGVALIAVLGSLALAAGFGLWWASRPVPVPAPPAPRPAPVAVSAPEPVRPAPAPAPPPPPATPPTAVPAGAETGTVAVAGGVPVELRRADERYLPGAVPVGTIEVWADVEQAGVLVRMTTFRLDPGAKILVTCSRPRRECRVQ